ncbi:MAG TPA: hypothetical protein VGL02_11175, partial [Streptomyces sp.]
MSMHVPYGYFSSTFHQPGMEMQGTRTAVRAVSGVRQPGLVRWKGLLSATERGTAMNETGDSHRHI